MTRAELRAGCMTVLEAYKAANPTQLAHVYDFPPGSYSTPLAYVEKAITESIDHDSGTRRRDLRVNVVVVNKLIDNRQATTEQDAVVEGLLDAFTANYRAASADTLLQPVGIAEPGELADKDGNRYAAVAIQIQLLDKKGRI